jgi:hypothetical protein
MLQVGAWPSRLATDAVRIARPAGALGSLRASRIAALAICGLLALFLAVELIVATHPGGILSGPPGFDYQTYMSATQRFLNGGGFYAPYQLAGPYAIGTRDILYPPSALWLFVPFTVLPAVLWWAIPLGIVGWVIASYRPSPWAWAAILALLVLPFPFDWHFSYALELVVTGNPAMWVVAAVAAGTRWRWPAAFVLLKPSLAPLALIGVRGRAWWLAAGGLAVLSLALVPLWIEYVTVVLNARGPRASLFYSVTDLPLMLIPIVAWLGRRR